MELKEHSILSKKEMKNVIGGTYVSNCFNSCSGAKCMLPGGSGNFGICGVGGVTGWYFSGKPLSEWENATGANDWGSYNGCQCVYHPF